LTVSTARPNIKSMDAPNKAPHKAPPSKETASRRRIKELLARGKRLLSSEPSSSLDASLLLAEASGLSREQLYSRADFELNEAQCGRYFELIERRRKGECTAYILGRKEFWGMEFAVSPAVLVPRPDTETLVEAALLIVRSIPHSPLSSSGSPLSALDLCTGSGAVAIALKHECPGLEVTAADISEEALEVARKNAELLGCGITFLRGDLFGAFTDNPDNPRFYLITANAPYVPSSRVAELPVEVKNEPRIALDGGDDGLALIRRVIAEAPQYLLAGGSLALEADPSQMETIAGLMKKQGFAEPELYRDLAGKNRVIAAEINA